MSCRSSMPRARWPRSRRCWAISTWPSWWRGWSACTPRTPAGTRRRRYRQTRRGGRPAPPHMTLSREADEMRILVVEDEQQLAAALKAALEEQGFAVDVAHTGSEGLGLAELGPYDLVVLDVLLPGLD